MANSFPPSPSAQPREGSDGFEVRSGSRSNDSPTQPNPEQILSSLYTAITGWRSGSGHRTAKDRCCHPTADRCRRGRHCDVARWSGDLPRPDRLPRATAGNAPQRGFRHSPANAFVPGNPCDAMTPTKTCASTRKSAVSLVCVRIAVVPLRGTHRVVGILEAFSSRPYSFPDRHLQVMTELSALAVAARSAHRQKTRTQGEIRPPVVKARLEPILPRLKRTATSLTQTLRRSSSYVGVMSAAAVGAVTLVSLGWMLFHGHAQQTPAPTTAQAAVRPADVPLPVAGSAALVFNGATVGASVPATAKPSAAVSIKGAQRSDASPASLVQRAAQTATLPSPQPSDDSPANASISGPDNPSATAAKADESVPLLASVAPPEPSTLGTVLSAPPSLPSRSVPISEGVSDGVVIRRVQPIYPAMARQSRLEGRVVLQATVTEDGTVHDLKVVSGHPVLARAAQDAVAQWRYRPFRLNGKPVSMPTEIKLDFKLP